MRIVAAAMLVVLALCGTARAAMFGELRGGLFVHGVGSAGLMDPGRLEDANLEFVFKPLIDVPALGSIQPVVGVTANFGGEESFGYAGLDWHVPVLITPFFVEAGLGGALGSNMLGQPVPSPSNPAAASAQAQQWSCAPLWHAQLSAGIQLTDLADVMLTGEHYRPMSACGTTAAVTNVGVRVGVSF